MYVKLKRRLADMEDCIFCKLANGDIPTDMVYQDDLIAVFRDAAPQAPDPYWMYGNEDGGELPY
jgi:hypothetical protein